jgi:NDP-sugar pyrophosphorylase family protein
MIQRDHTVLFLAGGFGTRLASVVSDVPKPMAPVAGKPFLEYLLQHYIDAGIKNFCFATGYKSKIIENYFGDGAKWKAKFQYSVETTPLGTGGAIKKAFQEKDYNDLIVVNADTFFKFDLNELIVNCRPTVTLSLSTQPETSRYGTVQLNSLGEIKSFMEKGHQGPGLINGGVSYVDKSIVEFIKNEFCSLEEEILPTLIKSKKIYGRALSGKFIDIGIPDDYLYFQKNLQDFLKK